MTLRNTAVATALLVTLSSPLFAGAAPLTVRPDLGSVDLGPARKNDLRSVSVALKLRNRPQLEAYVASTTDPASPNFRRFLTPAQFSAQYGQTAENVYRMTSYLQSQGLTIAKVHPNNLLIQARGTNAQLESVFNVSMRRVEFQGNLIQRPVNVATAPAAIKDIAAGVYGLSTQLVAKPNLKEVATIPQGLPGAGTPALTVNSTTGVPETNLAPNVRGSRSIAELSKRYNVDPLYERGRTGKGTTIGIVTFAHFDPKDATDYWAAIGLKVDPGRLKFSGITDNGYGAAETTLDVEQSGGIAPGASLIVYEPIEDIPNEILDFPIDVYTRAIVENKVDVITSSWGSSEFAGQYTWSNEEPWDAVFLQAAAQGIPVILASGDAGAYQLTGENNYPAKCTATLSVQSPANHPMVLAAGGTTVPFAGGTVSLPYSSISVPAERAWGWDYLKKAYGDAAYFKNFFPTGSGGGVSVVHPVPDYQQGVAGVKKTAPGQLTYCNDGSGDITTGLLPGNFAGRNIPDISLNADPITGYAVFYRGSWTSFGGTSVVAPQLAGIVSLLTEELGGRVGFLNPQLYGMLKTYGYGPDSPFNAITFGGNLFYQASATPGYNPASGIGTLNVDNLAKAMAKSRALSAASR